MRRFNKLIERLLNWSNKLRNWFSEIYFWSSGYSFCIFAPVPLHNSGLGFSSACWSEIILLITVSYDFDKSSLLDSLKKFNAAFISSQFWISSCKFVFPIEDIVERWNAEDKSWNVGMLERWNTGHEAKTL